MKSSSLLTDLQAKQFEWLENHPSQQAAWLIIYWHHEDNKETNGLSFYSGRDIVALYEATNHNREIFTIRGFDSLEKAIEMCRALRVSYSYALWLNKLSNPI